MTRARVPLRIAHRGIPRRERENTLASFALALREGAEGIELDVHTTADGHVVVHHDPALADGGLIAESALTALRTASGPHEIPTLGEVMALVGHATELFIELKGEGTELPVLGLLERYEGRAALHSFNHAAIGRAWAAGCRWPLGLLSEEFVEDVAALMRSHGACDYWPHDPLVTKELLHAVHSVGGRVIPWTVNSTDRMRELTTMGVDGICTDDVALLAQALRA